MAHTEDSGDEHKPKHHLTGLLKEGLREGIVKGKEGLAKGKEELRKGTLELEHKLGLGHWPNVIPAGDLDITGPPRTVELGWHPVAGFAGKWFAEKTGLGRYITEHTHMCPDPTQHWAVLVGDYCHELWMDEHFDVIYINEKLDRSQWHTYPIGHTRFSDNALRQAGEMTIFHMRAKQAAYNLISNNCQSFALQMLDAIQIGNHREFATSYEVYRAALGHGDMAALFRSQANQLPPPEQEQEAEKPPGRVMEHAHKVMDENTTKLDEHHTLW
ncbi:hypothetical protein HMN09_00982800 [Mycena chlorophos]|uniref:Uncharacterized protein n=1 Tax=Mycena chlorophos TaxID=658473 RepID=A0A8H6W5A1_MYCCL|nr:hypothetical protein HMN09_00982800 [Mycena chlorophos]